MPEKKLWLVEYTKSLYSKVVLTLIQKFIERFGGKAFIVIVVVFFLIFSAILKFAVGYYIFFYGEMEGTHEFIASLIYYLTYWPFILSSYIFRGARFHFILGILLDIACWGGIGFLLSRNLISIVIKRTNRNEI